VAGTLTVALALVLGLDTVDYQPFIKSSYYAETAARLAALPSTNVLRHGDLRAGFGRAQLTPTLNATEHDPLRGQFRSVPLAGYGAREGRPATGVHDDLWVKAAAFEVAGHIGVMVGADALIVPREVAESAAAQLRSNPGLQREQIYLSASHTHSSIGGWGEGAVAEAFAGPFQPGVREWFADRIVVAVRQAVADLKPASIGSGSFTAEAWIRNRLVGRLGQVDPEFSFLLVRQEEGVVGVIGSFSAHATVLSSDMMEFSADYPGAWQRAVEQSTGGCAVYLAGAVGSHSPVPGSGERGTAAVERMGQALARALLEQVPSIQLTNRIPFATLGLNVSLPPLHARLSDGLRLRPWIAGRLLPVHSDTHLQAFRLDDAVWISTPCDFSGELAIGVKEALQARGRRGQVTSFNGDYIGYIIPARYYHLDGYEPRLMSFFGPNAADYLVELIRALALRTAGAPEPASLF
jgi:hypothetical protein